MRKIIIAIAAAGMLAACDRGHDIGMPPAGTPVQSCEDQPQPSRPASGSVNVPRQPDC